MGRSMKREMRLAGKLADLERENRRLREALAVIEMESRDGGQWGFRDINDHASAALKGEV